MKTRKVAAKRFKITKSGKVKRAHSSTTHLSRKETSASRNRKKKDVEVVGKFAKKIKSFIVKKSK